MTKASDDDASGVWIGMTAQVGLQPARGRHRVVVQKNQYAAFRALRAEVARMGLPEVHGVEYPLQREGRTPGLRHPASLRMLAVADDDRFETACLLFQGAEHLRQQIRPSHGGDYDACRDVHTIRLTVRNRLPARNLSKGVQPNLTRSAKSSSESPGKP